MKLPTEKNTDFERLNMDNFNDFLLSHAGVPYTPPAATPTPVQSSTTPTAPVPSVPTAMSYTPVSAPVPAPIPSPGSDDPWI